MVALLPKNMALNVTSLVGEWILTAKIAQAKVKRHLNVSSVDQIICMCQTVLVIIALIAARGSNVAKMESVTAVKMDGQVISVPLNVVHDVMSVAISLVARNATTVTLVIIALKLVHQNVQIIPKASLFVI